jgi:hypothetical protein
MDIIQRNEAFTRGLVKYYTGVACRHGHLAQRYTSTSGCEMCLHPKIKVKGITNNPDKLAIINKQLEIEERKLALRETESKIKLAKELRIEENRKKRVARAQLTKTALVATLANMQKVIDFSYALTAIKFPILKREDVVIKSEEGGRRVWVWCAGEHREMVYSYIASLTPKSEAQPPWEKLSAYKDIPPKL